MKTKELLTIAAMAGEILLQSGAEIYRVEDTIIRICRAYNVECECFVLLTVIILHAEDEEGNSIALLKRIKGHTIDLQQIGLVNSFSRNLLIQTYSFIAAKSVLEAIKKKPRYRFVSRFAAASATAFVYTLLFMGSVSDGLVAFFISGLIYFVKEKISKLGFFLFFEYFISGIIVGAASLIVNYIFKGLDVYKIIIGSIMILVPGIAITNGIKDALYGDTVSSLYRITEAFFIAVAVGAGVGIVLALGM